MHCSVTIAVGVFISKRNPDAIAVGDHRPDLHRHSSADPGKPNPNPHTDSDADSQLQGDSDAQPESLYPGRLARLQEGEQRLQIREDLTGSAEA